MSASLLITIAVAWVLLPMMALFFPLLRLRSQRFSRERLPYSEVRPHLLTLLLPTGDTLVRRGFELVSAVRVHDFEATARDGRDGYHLVHRGERVHAYLRASSSPDRECPVMVVMESFLSDRGELVMLATMHARFTSTDLASARCITHFADAYDASGLLDAHLARRAELGHEVLDVDDESALARGSTAWNGNLDAAVARRDWVPAAESGWLRMTLRAALVYAGRKRFDAAWRRRIQENSRIAVSEGPAPVEEEVDGLARFDETLSRPLVRAHSLILFALGTGVFVLWYGWDGWQFGLLLAAVVLAHEAGHGLAMRLVGYRDVRIYFIPFFGGATSGLKRGASIHQEALVLLAGPMPGVFAAGAFALLALLDVLPASPLVVQVILILFAVNYINLLPVFPLDGGRVVHRLVAGRLPALEILLRLVAALALGGAALAMLDPLLGFLGAVALLGVPGAWRVARLERALRRSGADRLSGDARVAAIFDALAGLRGWSARLLLARQLEMRLASPDASWLSRFAWGSVYATCLFAPIPIALAGWIMLESRRGDTSAMFEVQGESPCAPGPVEIDPTATLVLCRAEPAAIAALLATLHMAQGLRGWCVPPPWSEAAVTPQQELARATTLELHRLWTSELEAAIGDGGASASTSRRDADRAAQDHIATRATAADFDAVAAQLWLSDDPVRRDELVARLGGSAECAPQWLAGLDEDQLALEPEEPARQAAWLCAHGCTSIGWNHWHAERAATP